MRKAGPTWVGWLLIALACGEASDPAGVSGDGGTSAGGSGTGLASTASPPHAPACSITAGALPFIQVQVLGTPPRIGTTRARVVARGLGAPPELTELPFGATSANQLGWVRVIEIAASSGSDAGTAAAADAGDEGVERVVVGPRELGELAVAIGAEVDLTDEFDGNHYLRQYHWRVVLRDDEHVLLFHQNTSMPEHMLGTFSGFTLERGDAVCASPTPNAESRCADTYHHELLVTAPGGMTASVTSGKVAVLGSYRVMGSTNTFEYLLPRNPGVGDGCNDLKMGPTLFTAVRLAAEPVPPQ